MHYDRRRRWAAKLRIPGKHEKAGFLDQCAIGDKLFALGYNVGIALGRGAILQDGCGAVQYDKAVHRALSSRLGSLDAAEKLASRLRFSRRLRNRRENVRTKDGEKLSNAG